MLLPLHVLDSSNNPLNRPASQAIMKPRNAVTIGQAHANSAMTLWQRGCYLGWYIAAPDDGPREGTKAQFDLELVSFTLSPKRST